MNTLLRRIIDVAIVLMLLAAAGGGVWRYRSQEQQHDDAAVVLAQVERLRDVMFMHRDLKPSDPPQLHFPDQLHSDWFEPADRPSNVLLHGDRPWIDLAAKDSPAMHPPDPVALSTDHAAFWYNPALGIVRARVPRQPTGPLTLALYNEVNGVALTDWPGGYVLPIAPADESHGGELVAAGVDTALTDDAKPPPVKAPGIAPRVDEPGEDEPGERKTRPSFVATRKTRPPQSAGTTSRSASD